MNRDDRMNQRGFSLVELLVTISLLAIILGLAVPSFNALMERTRITGSAYDMRRVLSIARSEAIKRSSQVRICNRGVTQMCAGTAASGRKHWNDHALIFIDRNRNRQFDSGQDELIHDLKLIEGVQVSWNRGDGLIFMPSGHVRWGSNGTFVLMTPSGSQLHLVLNSLGRVRSFKP